MKKRTLILTLTAVLAGGYAAVQTILPAEKINSTNTESYKPCYYNWAYHALPELSGEFESKVQALDPTASAYANAYGEDCIAEDGTSTFGAMETDFYVRLPVDDLSDFKSFGNWIAQVVKIIDALPAEKIVGPQIGFVEFKFSKSESDFLIVRVPLRDFSEKTAGLSGAELFNVFYEAP